MPGTEVFFSFLECLILLFGYVADQASFPKALDEEEEAIWIGKLERGDEEAKNTLIEHNLRLVAHVVKKYGNVGKDTDDLISIGTIGLIKGITTFDPNKKTRLATYAARCIENEILMMLRSERKRRGEVFLQDPLGTDREGNEISLLDILGTEPDEVFDCVESRLQLSQIAREVYEVLSDREQVVMELRYGLHDGLCRTQREIAKVLDISRSYVSRIEKKAIGKLKKAIEKDYKSQQYGV